MQMHTLSAPIYPGFIDKRREERPSRTRVIIRLHQEPCRMQFPLQPDHHAHTHTNPISSPPEPSPKQLCSIQ